jgi:hypothetical protein
LSEMCSFDQPTNRFEAHPESIEEMPVVALSSLGRTNE